MSTETERQPRDFAQEVAQLMLERGTTLATAESCTGGRVASLLTEVEGASNWYKGGVVAYTREAKMGVLGVPEEELQDGLVTNRCAKAMARMAAERLGADYGIATTGVCGPSESEGVPPCGVFVALYGKGGSEVCFFMDEDRGRTNNIENAAQFAISLFLEWCKEGVLG